MLDSIYKHKTEEGNMPFATIISKDHYEFHNKNSLEVNNGYLSYLKQLENKGTSANLNEIVSEFVSNVTYGNTNFSNLSNKLSKDSFTKQQAHENLAINFLKGMTDQGIHDVVHSVLKSTSKDGKVDLNNPLARAFLKAEIMHHAYENKENGIKVANSCIKEHFENDADLQLSPKQKESFGNFIGLIETFDYKAKVEKADDLIFSKNGNAITKIENKFSKQYTE